MTFDHDHFRGQLEANGAMANPCPACGKTDWVVSPSLSALFAADLDAVDLTDTQAMRVAAVGCKSCGYVRLHDPTLLS